MGKGSISSNLMALNNEPLYYRNMVESERDTSWWHMARLGLRPLEVWGSLADPSGPRGSFTSDPTVNS